MGEERERSGPHLHTTHVAPSTPQMPMLIRDKERPRTTTSVRYISTQITNPFGHVVCMLRGVKYGPFSRGTSEDGWCCNVISAPHKSSNPVMYFKKSIDIFVPRQICRSIKKETVFAFGSVEYLSHNLAIPVDVQHVKNTLA